MNSPELDYNIQQWSNKILDYLLNYKKTHEDFTFWLRERDNYDRLQKGFWFQGSYYIFFSPYREGDGDNRTKSIGFVVMFDQENNYKPYSFIELSFHSPNSVKHKSLYLDILRYFKSFNKINDKKSKYRLKYYNDNILNSLKNFIEKKKPLFDKLIYKHGYQESFIVTHEKFQSLLNRTLFVRQQNNKEVSQLITDIELSEYEGEEKKELYLHKWKERSKKFVAQFKFKYQNIKFCPACLCDIQKIYAIKPIHILELHHIVPLKYQKIKYKITEKDVLLLCPTCHRAIHRIMSIDNLKKITLEKFHRKLNLKR